MVRAGHSILPGKLGTLLLYCIWQM